ncbi:MAG: VanZ family protein [Lachnospiraceae bacterium]|nr:VanZ family protein [Lachnospiraceae bacterium]
MNKKLKILIAISFVIYLFVLIYVTFLNRVSMHYASIWDYARVHMNLIPGDSIKLYMKMFKNDTMRYIAVVNLGVNLFLLTPMSLFLMSLFKIMRKWYVLFSTCLFVLIIIEILQLLTMRGSFDVDDLILNMAGAVIGYFIWMIMSKSTRKDGANND